MRFLQRELFSENIEPFMLGHLLPTVARFSVPVFFAAAAADNRIRDACW